MANAFREALEAEMRKQDLRESLKETKKLSYLKRKRRELRMGEEAYLTPAQRLQRRKPKMPRIRKPELEGIRRQEERESLEGALGPEYERTMRRIR